MRVAPAPGSVLVVRDEEWLVTRTERSSDGEWFIDVRRLSELVRDTSATFSTALDDIGGLVATTGARRGRLCSIPVGLLVWSEHAGELLVRAMEERGVGSRLVSDKSVPSGKPVVMTMHRAKGMEFSRVLNTGADAASVPAAYALKDVPEAEREDALRRERSLLYVAATRARDELVIVWAGQPSELLPTTEEG